MSAPYFAGTAMEIGGTRQVFRFRSVDALARRVAGRTATWQEVHEPLPSAWRRVQILRPNRLAGGSDIVAVFMIPVEAIRAQWDHDTT